MRLEPISLPIIYCLMDIGIDSLTQTIKGFAIAVFVIKLLGMLKTFNVRYQEV